MDNYIEKVMQKIKDNNMECYYCEKKEDVRELVKKLIPEGSVVTNGGSMTLKECKIIDLVKNGNYNYLDRSAPNLTAQDIEEIYRKAFFADYFLTSSNAITENGELYNVDGNSNRIAAICYGPKNVIVIAGTNKIVKDTKEAVRRIKEICAPANCVRLNRKTYCKENGRCVSFLDNPDDIASGCNSEERICCNYLISSKQRYKNRIKVIIVGEKLGY